jgi:hypothetical protein
MTDGLPGVSSAAAGPGNDLHARVDALRARGAARFDAVGFRVIESMLLRVDGFDGAARGALVRKVERRLAALRERFEGAGGVAVCAKVEPEPAQARAGRSELAELLAHVAGHAATPAAAAHSAPAGGGAEPAAELKSLRYFRSTWSRLSLEQQLSRALAQAPDNAGPLNSHFLVLQALIRMRDIAPSYLESFIAHVDALLWLEQADAGRGAAAKAGARKGEARAQSARARKPTRKKAG